MLHWPTHCWCASGQSPPLLPELCAGSRGETALGGSREHAGVHCLGAATQIRTCHCATVLCATQRVVQSGGVTHYPSLIRGSSAEHYKPARTGATFCPCCGLLKSVLASRTLTPAPALQHPAWLRSAPHRHLHAAGPAGTPCSWTSRSHTCPKPRTTTATHPAPVPPLTPLASDSPRMLRGVSLG